ncbi:MAG: transporter ATP-binding protein [Rhodospirillales bacterium]|nr:transporter ATP-binding protein [Rhodospirillales bacterium]
MSQGLLQLTDIVAGYGDVMALHGVSLAVRDGSVTALLGSNGAGKSTLLKTAAGILTPRRGEIAFDGAAIAGKRASERVERGIVLIPEGRLIFPEMSVEENLRVGAFAPHARPHVARGLERAYALFPRLAERRRQSGGTLSGGEQQMLALGRGLMAEPRLLLLDEPTLGLAPLIAQSIFTVIERLRADGLTILLAEQDARRTLAIADYGYVLESGTGVMEGSGAELLADPKINSAYLGL